MNLPPKKKQFRTVDGDMSTAPAYQVLQGDVLEHLAAIHSNSFDDCFCDPPYGLGFMGKSWDHGVPGAEVWAEVLRVLKPGAHLMAFGGTRTYHRLACNIEDAGFELRDCVMWIYGSGFPKSMSISLALDKHAGAKREVLTQQIRKGRSGGILGKETEIVHTMSTPNTAAAAFDGYGTALKPAWEPCLVAMKQLDGTYAENALKHGLAGLHINGGRVGEELIPTTTTRGVSKLGTFEKADGNVMLEHNGRWPANLILNDDLEEQVWSRFFYCAKAAQTERNAGCEALPMVMRSDGGQKVIKNGYQNMMMKNHHPCVKPIDLCRYLAPMMLPPKRDTPRKLLVPFCGSGSEMLGALNAGWDAVTGIELEAEYVKIANARLKHRSKA